MLQQIGVRIFQSNSCAPGPDETAGSPKKQGRARQRVEGATGGWLEAPKAFLSLPAARFSLLVASLSLQRLTGASKRLDLPQEADMNPRDRLEMVYNWFEPPSDGRKSHGWTNANSLHRFHTFSTGHHHLCSRSSKKGDISQRKPDFVSRPHAHGGSDTGWFSQTGKIYEDVDTSCNCSLGSGSCHDVRNSLTFALSAGWFLELYPFKSF